MTNLFERATKQKVRFTTKKGVLSVEEVWDLPLQSKSGLSLDNLAQGLNKTIKETGEISFVEEKTTVNSLLVLKFDLVKHIIKVRLQEKEVKAKRADNKAKKDRIMNIIADKKDEALLQTDVADLEKMLAELDN